MRCLLHRHWERTIHPTTDARVLLIQTQILWKLLSDKLIILLLMMLPCLRRFTHTVQHVCRTTCRGAIRMPMDAPMIPSRRR
jgi:hypothetical protein